MQEIERRGYREVGPEPSVAENIRAQGLNVPDFWISNPLRKGLAKTGLELGISGEGLTRGLISIDNRTATTINFDTCERHYDDQEPDVVLSHISRKNKKCAEATVFAHPLEANPQKKLNELNRNFWLGVLLCQAVEEDRTEELLEERDDTLEKYESIAAGGLGAAAYVYMLHNVPLIKHYQEQLVWIALGVGLGVYYVFNKKMERREGLSEQEYLTAQFTPHADILASTYPALILNPES